MQDQVKVLLVEDDENMGFLLKENLRSKGFDVTVCQDGEEGQKAFDEGVYDLCLLDVMLPKKDGFNLAKHIRTKNENVPIIFLTAKAMVNDKILGFEMGGDDYITKPFSSQELLLRIKAVLKRTKPEAEPFEQVKNYNIGSYGFDYLNRMLKLDGKEKKVSAKEAELLKIFADNKNQLLNRQFILKTVWGEDDYFTSKSMDVYLTRLRKLLREDDNIELQNVHGIGYKMIINEKQAK